MENITLHQHHMASPQEQASHLQEILRHATNHPNQYHTYQLTLIQTQFHQILLRQTHLTHLTPDIINKDDIHAINSGEKGVTTNLLKFSAITEQSKLRLRA